MTFQISAVTEVRDHPALAELITEYYGVVLKKLEKAGGPTHYKAQDLAAAFLSDLHPVLSPTGRLVLVHDANQRLVGCGTLHKARADAGELKRLYVRPEANGHRLGQAIVDLRIQAARDMGWKSVLVNAIKGNSDMLRIYEKMGFRYIDRYPECSDPSEIAEFFIYMQYDLD